VLLDLEADFAVVFYGVLLKLGIVALRVIFAEVPLRLTLKNREQWSGWGRFSEVNGSYCSDTGISGRYG